MSAFDGYQTNMTDSHSLCTAIEQCTGVKTSFNKIPVVIPGYYENEVAKVNIPVTHAALAAQGQHFCKGFGFREVGGKFEAVFNDMDAGRVKDTLTAIKKKYLAAEMTRYYAARGYTDITTEEVQTKRGFRTHIKAYPPKTETQATTGFRS